MKGLIDLERCMNCTYPTILVLSLRNFCSVQGVAHRRDGGKCQAKEKDMRLERFEREGRAIQLKSRMSSRTKEGG